MKNNEQTKKTTSTYNMRTKDEIRNSKLQQKQQEKKYYDQKKETRKQNKKLKKNFQSMNSCMIHPTNIKIGRLEKLVHSKVVNNYFLMGIGNDEVEKIYELIGFEKVFIEVKPDSKIYFDLDEINSNKDLHEIRKQINIDGGITIGGKLLDCFSGKIRINKESLHSNPYFEENDIDNPVSIKQLKKIVEESRK